MLRVPKDYTVDFWTHSSSIVLFEKFVPVLYDLYYTPPLSIFYVTNARFDTFRTPINFHYSNDFVKVCAIRVAQNNTKSTIFSPADWTDWTSDWTSNWKNSKSSQNGTIIGLILVCGRDIINHRMCNICKPIVHILNLINRSIYGLVCDQYTNRCTNHSNIEISHFSPIYNTKFTHCL